MQKTYIVTTKEGSQFEVNAFNLPEAKQTASFNARRMDEKIERVSLKKKITGRGGPGRGQGRKTKYGEETTTLRVPKSLVPEIEKFIESKKN